MMSPKDNPHFHGSPFSVVASPQSAACWAGRPTALKRLLKLKRTWNRRPDCSLDVIWANFGAGKTHALLHLKHLLEHDPDINERVVCVYIELPEQVRSFLDLYRQVTKALPISRVATALLQARSSEMPAGLRRAANVLIHGEPSEKEIVQEWLLGGRPHLRDLRRCSGIGYRIENDVAAVDHLCGIGDALSTLDVRLVLMIDEFQRISVLRSNAREAVLSSLRSMFSRCPHHLSVVLAIMSRVEQTALTMIPDELRTLIGHTPSITLPEMDPIEADDFVRGRFKFFRPTGYTAGPTAPFEEETVREILQFLRSEADVPLTPREIIQALAWVYDEVEPGEIIDAEVAMPTLRATYLSD